MSRTPAILLPAYLLAGTLAAMPPKAARPDSKVERKQPDQQKSPVPRAALRTRTHHVAPLGPGGSAARPASAALAGRGPLPRFSQALVPFPAPLAPAWPEPASASPAPASPSPEPAAAEPARAPAPLRVPSPSEEPDLESRMEVGASGRVRPMSSTPVPETPRAGAAPAAPAPLVRHFQSYPDGLRRITPALAGHRSFEADSVTHVNEAGSPVYVKPPRPDADSGAFRAEDGPGALAMIGEDGEEIYRLEAGATLVLLAPPSPRVRVIQVQTPTGAEVQRLTVPPADGVQVGSTGSAPPAETHP